MSNESKNKTNFSILAAVILLALAAYGIFSGRETEVEIPGVIRAKIGEQAKTGGDGVKSTADTAKVSDQNTALPAQILSVGSISSCIKEKQAILNQGGLGPRELINACFVSGHVSKLDFDLAERHELLLGKKLKMPFDTAYAIAEVGYGFFEQGQYTASKIFFEAMVLLNYSDAYFHSMVGSSYMAQKQWIAAVDSFNKSIRYDAQNVRSLLNRGECLYLLGQKDKALKDFKAVLATTRPDAQDSIARAQWIIKNHY